MGPTPRINPSEVEPVRSRTMQDVLAEVRTVIDEATRHPAPAGGNASLRAAVSSRTALAYPGGHGDLRNWS